LAFRCASAFLPTLSSSETRGKGKEKEKVKKTRVDDALGADAVRECLGYYAQRKSAKEELIVAVVGGINVSPGIMVNQAIRLIYIRSVREVITRQLARAHEGPTRLRARHGIGTGQPNHNRRRSTAHYRMRRTTCPDHRHSRSRAGAQKRPRTGRRTGIACAQCVVEVSG
jgi:hypothetical protein